MAKILTGPLAAGLSGKLGPVVFHQTRFGQVVQSKAKGKVYKTPAAMATKFAFGTASKGVGVLGDYMIPALQATWNDVPANARAQLIKNVSALIRGDSVPGWPTRDPDGFIPPIEWGAPTSVPGQLRIPYEPVGAVGNVQGLMVSYDAVTGWQQSTGLSIGLVDGFLVTAPGRSLYPCAVIAFQWIQDFTTAAPKFSHLGPPYGWQFETAP